MYLEWFSYRAGYQPLNHPATPFSTSRKVLQRYDLFLKPPNFSRKKSGGLALKSVRFRGRKCAVYGSKPWELRFALRDNGQQTTDNRQRTTDNGHTTAIPSAKHKAAATRCLVDLLSAKLALSAKHKLSIRSVDGCL